LHIRARRPLSRGLDLEADPEGTLAQNPEGMNLKRKPAYAKKQVVSLLTNLIFVLVYIKNISKANFKYPKI
jgi:hypothetical protein